MSMFILKNRLFSFVIVSFFFLIYKGRPDIIYVGMGKTCEYPSQAAMMAADGDTIEIDAKLYSGDVAIFRQNNLTIRGIGGYAHLTADGNHAEGKAIWVIKGNNINIENIRFSGAKVPDQNGAGIRHEGINLIIRNCYFHDNENGILTSNNPNNEIIIENSEFSDNGYGDGQSHNMYIGQIKSFTIKYSYIHHAKIGHNIKSRARKNYILYNRIMDEKDGTASYQIDFPYGGQSFVIGNLIQQGPHSDNSTIISYGAEGLKYKINEIFIINNSMINDRHSGLFIKINDGTTFTRIQNNIFAGPGEILNGPGNLISNLLFPDIHKTFSIFSKKPGFVNMKNYNYRLLEDSPAINAGSNPGKADGFDLTPQWEYVHPKQGHERINQNKIDIGAYEYHFKK